MGRGFKMPSGHAGGMAVTTGEGVSMAGAAGEGHEHGRRRGRGTRAWPAPRARDTSMAGPGSLCRLTWRVVRAPRGTWRIARCLRLTRAASLTVRVDHTAVSSAALRLTRAVSRGVPLETRPASRARYGPGRPRRLRGLPSSYAFSKFCAT
jgi:hypothetical protein